MGKAKKKAGLANSVQEKKAKTKPRVNPFEIRFSREKHSVVNRKKKSAVFGISSNKNEAVGRPGMARSRAIQKRKDTLLQEYKRKNKKNVFVDKRIGEKDAELSAEDKMIARFTAERMKGGAKKKNIFNLGEEESLTHYGQSIADIEQFDDDPRSDDDEDEVSGSKHMSSDQNFGGFLTQNDLEFSSGKSNSRKDWIEEMIAESKKRKFEHQKDKEEVQKITQELDTKWREVGASLKLSGQIYSKKPLSVADEANESEGETDEYNKLLKELSFAPKKAKAMDRLKTDEEIVQEDRDKLARLEAERLKRMNNEEEEEDGESEEHEEAEDEADGDDDDDDSASEDEYSDLEEDDGEEQAVGKAKRPAAKDNKAKLGQAVGDLPFTFEVPKAYPDLQKLFDNRNATEKATIIERMVKCNHPQLGNNNKANLETLFTFLLQHIHDCTSLDTANEDPEAADEAVQVVHALTPFLFDLAKFSPQPSGEAIRGVLIEKHADYAKSPRSYPGFESLIFLKLATVLFPTSDYRHPVVTPALQWMSQILTICRPFSRSSLASGLFVAATYVESLQLSKRFCPELLNFLTGIVHMAVPKDEKTIIPIVSPFKVVGKESTLLADKLGTKKQPSKLKIRNSILSEKDIDEEFAASALDSALNLTKKLVDLWKSCPSAQEIFSPLKTKYLPLLNEAVLHKNLADSIADLQQKLAEIGDEKARTHVEFQRKKAPVKMLRLYEPDLDESFDPFQKKRVGSKDKLEMQKLNHKMKRERKGAKKEIRADTAFLAKQKAKEMREKDAERIAKTKAIMSGLGGQEGEYRKLQKQKKKKKS